MMKLLFGPLIVYFGLVLYAVLMVELYGQAWLRDVGNLAPHYVVGLSWYYTLCLFGHTLKFIKNQLPISH